jgi:hypothetical protein
VEVYFRSDVGTKGAAALRQWSGVRMEAAQEAQWHCLKLEEITDGRTLNCHELSSFFILFGCGQFFTAGYKITHQIFTPIKLSQETVLLNLPRLLGVSTYLFIYFIRIHFNIVDFLLFLWTIKKISNNCKHVIQITRYSFLFVNHNSEHSEYRIMVQLEIKNIILRQSWRFFF